MPTSDSVENLVGERLVGRYLVVERIGQGGMATVYRAIDEQLGRDVALKVFHRGLTSPDDLRRQESEVRHLARLAHPCLVTLYDAISEHERGFLVLEYVRGQDLRTRLKEGPLPPSVVAELGRDIAHALAHIHSRDLIHRDVSPGNILLPVPAPHEQGVTAKLTDLGIARVVDAGHITATGTLIGTAAYLSPEQVSGRSVSAATDIYSLGLVLLECLTGERAYEGPVMESAVARLTRDPEVPRDVPAHWRRVIDALTAREPADRPSASQAAVALADPNLSADPRDSQDATALLTAPVFDPAPTETTSVLEQPEPDVADTVTLRVGSTFSDSPAVERLRAMPTSWILSAVAGLALLIVLAWVVTDSGGSLPTAPPSPNYPTVPGQLGVHLKQLQHEVAPN